MLTNKRNIDTNTKYVTTKRELGVFKMLVCSKSTRKYFPDEKDVIIVGDITEDILPYVGKYKNVTAIGGGTVIDMAKIISEDPVVCYPTTAAGSCSTSHSVYWEGIYKKSLKRMKPWVVYIMPDFVKDVPEKIIEYTTYDVISHCLDSMWSINRTKKSVYYAEMALEMLRGCHSYSELIHAGNIAGEAIEICPTTILHSLSYPLTGIYKIPHGKALGYLLPKVCEYMEFDLGFINPNVILNDIDIDRVIKEALKYTKIYDIEKNVSMEILREVMK